MAKYNEGSLTGESWTRAFQIIVSNEYNQIPTIKFDEEDIIVSGDRRIINRNGTNIIYAFTPSEAETEFNLVNPLTDQPLGITSKYQDLYVLLYSIYYHMAELRDRGLRPYPSWVWNEIAGDWEAPVPKPYPSWAWNEVAGDWEAPVPKPYPSWAWNEVAGEWEAPVPKPDLINEYIWNENTLSWDLI